MNDFSKQAISTVEKLYKTYMVDDYNIVAVAIGGSIARGYGCQGSDVDLLLFCKNIGQYQKKFPEEHNLNLELHYIRCDVLNYLNNKVAPIFSEPHILNKKIINEDILGEKKCELYKNKSNSLNALLSAWRELKKMTDTIILYEKDKYYNDFCSMFLSSKISKNKILNMITDLISKDQSIETVIKMIKLSAIYQNDVFSKVLWLDRFLENKQDLKNIVKNLLGSIPPVPLNWLEQAKEILSEATRIQKNIKCDTCKGDIRRCNLGRCFHDYLNDAERARNEGYLYGSWLSLKKSIDYAQQLTSVSGIHINMPKDYIEYWESKRNINHDIFKELIASLFEKTPIEE